MNLRPRRLPRRSAGFTLVEVLLAIALSTVIIGGAASFVFSSYHVLYTTQNDPQLERHKMGVTTYLNNLMENAPPSNATNTSNSGNLFSNNLTSNSTASTSGNTSTSGNNTAGGSPAGLGGASGGSPFSSSLQSSAGRASTTTNRVVWAPLPGSASNLDDLYLSFRIDGEDPVLVWGGGGPRPPATAWLYYKKGEQGLSLVWQTDQQQQLDPDDYFRTVLSPLVSEVMFYYYDTSSQTWQDPQDTPLRDSSGNAILPNFIRLTFNIKGNKETMPLLMPGNTTTVPIY